jgi:hypothetical protein
VSFEEWDIAFLWRCDTCGYEVAFKPRNFYACVDELKERGWLFSLEEETGHEGWGRTWHHYCQRCRRGRQQTSIMDRTFSRPREVIKGGG